MVFFFIKRQIAPSPSLLRGVAMASIVALLSVFSQTAHAQTDDKIELMGVRARVKQAPQIRLLWLPTQGWLPPSGVNVFRSDKPGEPLNTAPIVLEAQALDAKAKTVINTKIAPGKVLFGDAIVGRATNSTSSQAAFLAFKTEAVRLKGENGVHPVQIAARAAKEKKVADYRNRLLPPKAITRKVPGTPPPPLTGDEATISVRVQILMTSLINYQAAQKLGLAFVDPTAAPGTVYTYTLKAADAGAATLATVSVPVDQDAKPPAPTDLDSVQTGQGSVALHWEPVSEDAEKKIASAWYSVYRGGVKINPSPLRIAFQPTKDGGHVASMSSFVDSAAPLGPVSYTVKLTDAFGRESDTAATSVTVSDLRVPGPLSHVAARLSKTNPGAVRIFWRLPDPLAGDIAPTQAGSAMQSEPVAVDIFRSEAGQASNETKLTTSAPTPGTPLSDITTSSTTNPPADVADMTGAELFTLYPEVEALFRSGIPQNAPVEEKYLSILRTLDIGSLYTFGWLSSDQKSAILQATRNLRSYLSTSLTPDKDYQFHLEPCYVVNPARHGTPAQTAIISVPTSAAPPSPKGLAGVFTKGAGSFGFVETGATSNALVMRREGMMGVEREVSHLPAKIVQKFGGATNPSAPTASPARITTTTVLNQGAGTRVAGGQRPTAPQRNGNAAAAATMAAVLNTPADGKRTISVPIAGRVKLTWQPVSFTSKVRYRVYRAIATGLFPVTQTASLGLPPAAANLNTIQKIGVAQRPPIKSVAQKRLTQRKKFSSNFAGVPNQDYTLLGVTDTTDYVDNVPPSQRVHYNYRVMPLSRWGVEGPETPLIDVQVPASLPPSLPTLLKTEVDEAATNGQVRLTISVNPAQDNVQKYLVFRKPVDESLHAALIDRSSLRVASTNKRFAPPAPKVQSTGLVTPPKAQNLNIRDIKANGAAILKRFLDPAGYVNVGEVPTSSSAATVTFTDTTGLPKVPYTYQVVAVNTDAIASLPSSPMDATALKVKAEAPRNFKGTFDSGAAQITVTWQAPAHDVPAHYVLERASEHLAAAATTGPSVNGRPGAITLPPPSLVPLTFVTINGSVDAQTGSFPDADIRSGRKYVYRLRAVDADGLFSDPLQVAVVFPPLAKAAFNDPAPSPSSPAAPTVIAANPNAPTAAPTNPAPAAAAPAAVAAAAAAGAGGISSPKPATRAALFGQPYYLTSGQIFAVRVEKAAFRAQSYAIDAQNFYYCRPTEKFLQLTLRVKNTTAQPQPFDYQTVTAASTTSDGAELAVTKNWKALDTNLLANRTVAPNGEFLVEGVLTIPAEGTPASLAFGDCVFGLMPGTGNLIDALPAPFGGGETIAPEYAVPDAKAFWSMAYTDAALASGGFATENNASVYVITMNVRNATKQTIQIAPSNYTVELLDEDGDKYAAQKNTAAPTPLAPNAQTVLRWSFVVPKTIHLTTFKARERDSRVYVFPIGAK